MRKRDGVLILAGLAVLLFAFPWWRSAAQCAAHGQRYDAGYQACRS